MPSIWQSPDILHYLTPRWAHQLPGLHTQLRNWSDQHRTLSPSRQTASKSAAAAGVCYPTDSQIIEPVNWASIASFSHHLSTKSPLQVFENIPKVAAEGAFQRDLEMKGDLISRCVRRSSAREIWSFWGGWEKHPKEILTDLIELSVRSLDKQTGGV